MFGLISKLDGGLYRVGLYGYVFSPIFASYEEAKAFCDNNGIDCYIERIKTSL